MLAMADSTGGGAYSGTLDNCMLRGNSAYLGGGGSSSFRSSGGRTFRKLT